MSKLSRRSLVASAAALAALAVPAVVSTATTADDRLVSLAAVVCELNNELCRAIEVTDAAQGGREAAYIAAQAAQEAIGYRIDDVIDATRAFAASPRIDCARISSI